MTLWNPALWDDFGTVGIAVFVCSGIVVAVVRGWLVPRSLHREIVDGKDSTITDLRARAIEDAATIKLQAQTISEKDAVEDAVTRLLQATRTAAEGGR